MTKRRPKPAAEVVGATGAEPREQAEPARGEAVASAPGMNPPVDGGDAEPLTSGKPQYGYGGEISALPTGKAHLRDFGNRAGIDVILDLPEGEKPAPGVTEPLKEYHVGHTSFQYKGQGRWHKRLSGPGLDPVEERADAHKRYAEAVKRQREATQGEGGHAR